MNVCVFLGPTLPAAEAARVLDAVYLPPAAQGDVLLAVEDGAHVIGIVDGVFQGVPSVWHKEVLWALSRGVHVLGSSSMGALRAAELAPFGMRGVGRVFEAYRDGVITDDDEVAVVHGPEEIDYHAGTVPLVNIRATVREAVSRGLIGNDTHDLIVDTARGLPYWERTYEAVLDACRPRLEPGQPDRLARWIARHAVDQKREDALALLHEIARVSPDPFRAPFDFQSTDAWRGLADEIRCRRGEPPGDGPAHDAIEPVLDELRLEPDMYRGLAREQVPGANTAGHAHHPLIEALASAGLLEHFRERAADKRRTLLVRFGTLPVHADVMLSPSEILAWHFEDCLGVRVPVDLDGHARSLGLDDAGALCRLLLHEVLYLEYADPGDPGKGES